MAVGVIDVVTVTVTVAVVVYRSMRIVGDRRDTRVGDTARILCGSGIGIGFRGKGRGFGVLACLLLLLLMFLVWTRRWWLHLWSSFGRRIARVWRLSLMLLLLFIVNNPVVVGCLVFVFRFVVRNG